MLPIGGYFSLELPIGEEYYPEAIKLNTGRNCLEYILRFRKYDTVYIPYYTCDVVLEPFHKLDVKYEFYQINEKFEIVDDNLCLKDNSALLYTNYWGIKNEYVRKLISKYGKQLIIDNTQAFYSKPINGIDSFNTCRKFFGVSDGAYLFMDIEQNLNLPQDESYQRMTFLTKRIDVSAEKAYSDFREISSSLVDLEIRRMSKLTQRFMQSIDYKAIAQKRRDNFKKLNISLKSNNRLKLDIEDEDVPMVYPYLTDTDGFRQFLIENKIFVAKYWPNVNELAPIDSTESYLANHLIPLPIDQRYDENDMNYIIKKINEYGNKVSTQ